MRQCGSTTRSAPFVCRKTGKEYLLLLCKSPFVLATTEEMHYIMVPNPILIRNMRVTMNKPNDAVEIQEAIHKVAVLKVRYYQSRF